MHRFTKARRWAMTAVAIALLAGGGGALVQAQEPMRNPQPVKTDKTGAVLVPIGASVRLETKNKKLVTNVKILRGEQFLRAEVDAIDPRIVILVGRAQGSALLEVTDADRGVETYEIVIQADIEQLRSLIRRAVPTASVEAIPFGSNRVILSGNVAHAEDVNKILEIATAIFGSVGGQGGGQGGGIINAMTVGGVHQVQLDVTVASVSRTKARQRGFSFVVGGSTVSAGSLLGGLIAPSGTAATQTALAGVGVIPSAFQTLNGAGANAGNLPFGIVPAGFQGVLRALKNENVAKITAETKVVTQSGRPAQIQSGGQQPTIGGAAGINGPGVEYRDVGTLLSVTPIVYGNGKIYMEVSPTIRGVDQGRGIVTAFGPAPFFTQQSVTTSVVMEPGQTYAIGGVMQNERVATSTKVPVIGEIPFLSALFSAGTEDQSETELIILVTPYLVDALDCSQVPGKLPGQETRSPDDFEFFLETMLELPRGQRNVFVGKHYQAPWKVDPTAGTYPCGTGDCGTGAAGCATGTCAPAATGTGHKVGHGLKAEAAPAAILAPTAAAPAPMPNPPGLATINGPAPGMLPAPATPAVRTVTLPQEPAGMPVSNVPSVGPQGRPALPPLPVPRQ